MPVAHPAAGIFLANKYIIRAGERNGIAADCKSVASRHCWFESSPAHFSFADVSLTGKAAVC